jgi:cleavage and polyadenylation specificity factor subunit 3
MWVAISSFSGRVQDVMNEPEEVMSQKGNPIQRKISVDYISFSAHVDYSQNSEFIELVKAQHVVRLLGLPTVSSFDD